jgi:protein-L-isoaspartate(D-aspartate) O-methyltransferase
MEELQSLLRTYRLSHTEDLKLAPWSSQYCEQTFPKYWGIVYSILRDLNKDLRIIEIGCGLGDITAILVYLDFKSITSFEKEKDIALAAQRTIMDLFRKDGIVVNLEYPDGNTFDCDILIMVNCAYGTLASSKEEYLHLLKYYYECAGKPKYFIMEVIDSSYDIEDKEFPSYIRLDKSDVADLFPNHLIKEWETYKYPVNRRSKTLYLIYRRT